MAKRHAQSNRTLEKHEDGPRPLRPGLRIDVSAYQLSCNPNVKVQRYSLDGIHKQLDRAVDAVVIPNSNLVNLPEKYLATRLTTGHTGCQRGEERTFGINRRYRHHSSHAQRRESNRDVRWGRRNHCCGRNRTRVGRRKYVRYKAAIDGVNHA